MNVAIQGQPGSFHYEAAERLLGPQFDALDCETFPEVFAAVADGQVDCGVVAVANTLNGSINEVYRLLQPKEKKEQERLWVCGETILQIEQCLIGPSRRELEDVETVMSQSPALAQCVDWLANHLPQARLRTHNDTAASVQYVMEHPDEPLAAVAGRRAAEIYDGQILASPINDVEHNYTRFFLLSRDGVVENPTKTSIILELDHESGALAEALGTIATAGVNLSNIHSHPVPPTELGEAPRYSIYLDLQAGLDDELDRKVLDPIRDQVHSLTVLGTYVGADSL